jgi:hypothetical protein
MEAKFIIIGGKALTAYIDGEHYILNHDHPSFDIAAMALLSGENEKAKTFMNVDTAIKEFLGKNSVEIVDGSVVYNGEKLNGLLCDRILSAMKEGIDAGPFINFLERLMHNPSNKSKGQLFKFVEKCGFTITPEGKFLGYKAITDDWKDKRSGKYDNSIGNTVSMLRQQVCDDEEIGCGSGLHVGTLEYAMSFSEGNDRVVIVEVDPAYVVSVPKDHNWSKLRCCEYKVVGEFTRKYDEIVCDDFSEEKIERKSIERLDFSRKNREVECCEHCGATLGRCDCS